MQVRKKGIKDAKQKEELEDDIQKMEKVSEFIFSVMISVCEQFIFFFLIDVYESNFFFFEQNQAALEAFKKDLASDPELAAKYGVKVRSEAGRFILKIHVQLNKNYTPSVHYPSL